MARVPAHMARLRDGQAEGGSRHRDSCLRGDVALERRVLYGS